jgi:hypothetical protein
MSPAMARSRSLRKLASSAAVSVRSSPRGNRRGSRSDSFERAFGLPRWASSPLRSPTALRRAAGLLGTGFLALGSRISRKLNSPEIAARRRLIVLGANPRARPLANGITLSCWPLRLVVRHAAR